MLGSLLASLALAQAPALPSWQAIDTLLARGQTERAAEATARRLEAARTGPAPQDVELARALARLSGLALQRDPREAVAILEAQPRPKSPAPRAVVELAFATALGAFLEANHWRLGARERIETSGPVALEQRTVAQLEADVERALAAAWEQREALGRVPHADFADVVDRPSTPEGAGDTLRDAVTLLWARHLTLASRSSPER
ncbi:MAG: hypothetical protein INH41_07460, partial [Myxococcaceae bacterium]|nr:hypothetical protein [Myxococcaceae bacterium]